MKQSCLDHVTTGYPLTCSATRPFVKRNQELHCFVFHFPDISSNMNLLTSIFVDELLVFVTTFLALYSCIPLILVSEYISILSEFGGFSKCY